MSNATKLKTSDIEHALKIIAEEEKSYDTIKFGTSQVQGVLSYDIGIDVTSPTVRNHGLKVHGHIYRKYDSISSSYKGSSPVLVADPEEFLKELEEKRPDLFDQES